MERVFNVQYMCHSSVKPGSLFPIKSDFAPILSTLVLFNEPGQLNLVGSQGNSISPRRNHQTDAERVSTKKKLVVVTGPLAVCQKSSNCYQQISVYCARRAQVMSDCMQPGYHLAQGDCPLAGDD